jgi:hypothetical protein
LEEVVEGLKGLGYTFVAPATNVRPTIVSAPANLGVTNGSRIVLASAAVGTAPLNYQWMFNGTNIPGATNATYIIAAANAAKTGSYTIAVTNAFGAVTSGPARLQVTAPFALYGVQRDGTGCLFHLQAANGIVYTIQYKSSATDPVWQVLRTIMGDGSAVTITGSGGNQQQFYRVIVE